MMKVGGGAVVNISSALSYMVETGFVAYGTAKAALSHMTRLLAHEWAPHIRVNAIAVGATETDALSPFLNAAEGLREQMVGHDADGAPRHAGGHCLCGPLPRLAGGELGHRQDLRGRRRHHRVELAVQDADRAVKKNHQRPEAREMSYRVIQWGTGNVGTFSLRCIIDHPELRVGRRLRAQRREGRQGRRRAVRRSTPVGVRATNDVDAILALDADCVCYTATADLRPFEAVQDICRILASGKNVVSSSVVPLVHPEVVRARAA